MKLNPLCMCCAANKQEKKIRKFPDMARKTEYMQKVMTLIGNPGENACTPSLSADLRKLYREFWSEPAEDYTAEKKEFNSLMLGLESNIEKNIRFSDDALKTALLYSRIGNYIDFAALSKVDRNTILNLIHRENKDPLDPVEYGHLKEDLSQAARLVYITDNCGEIVLDKLVIKVLKSYYPNLDITVIVRGFPVVNDATMEDALETGLADLVTVIGNGSDAPGTWLPGISKEARKCIEEADVVIAKGQGNFESLHECGLNIYYLFLCKCDWFQQRFHAKPLQGMFLNERRIITD